MDKGGEKKDISLDLLVEAILDYGDCNNIKKIFQLIGIKRVTEIFYRQKSRRRVNYHPRTLHFFDLYFILKYHYCLKKISQRALRIYKTSFNEKLFREQLCYFKDIDYSESIEYMKTEIDEEEIKKFLTNTALTPF